MKKILYVTNISRTVNTFFIPHMNQLVDVGHQVDCACKLTGEHKLKKEKIDDRIKFYDIPFTRNPLDYKNIIAFLKLYKIQKKEKYDIIHVHTPIASFYTRLLKIFFNDVRMIYTVHGFHFYKGSSKISWIIFGNIEKLFSKLTDTLITINNEDFEVAKTFKCNDVRKINGVGVDFSEFKTMDKETKIKLRESVGVEIDDFVLIMVGEHNKNKNQIQLIKAIEDIEKINPKIKAILIGDGELLEENKRYISDNNIKNVKVLGFRKDVNEMINISDVLISMSYREGLPKNVIEAMACSKPLILTDIRGNRDLVMNNKNGFIVNVGDIEHTKKAIIKLYNIENIDYLGNKSLEYSKIYDVNLIVQEISKCY